MYAMFQIVSVMLMDQLIIYVTKILDNVLAMIM